MKKNSIISAFVGLILGSIVTYIYCLNEEAPTYFELSEDVYIGEIGNLKKGTIVRYDDSYPEGFTRFILYLNAKGIDLKEYETDKDEIIPYWLEKKE
tara:strand:+ start:270 stop:560 length:291 start_codon:yes stop_codon:yes gene_type:complete